MAGHSKFKNIQHRKGAQDKRRAKVFTKLVREIITATKSGQIDPEHNPRLRHAISAARSQNLPKERIDKAILSGSDPKNTEDYQEIRYEGFMPGGIAIIIEALTDNKNRTAGEVRAAFVKFGGNLGETGSVSFMFDHLGIIEYPLDTASNDEMLASSIDAGATDIFSDEMHHYIYTLVKDFKICEESLIKKYGMPSDSRIGWKPHSHILVEDDEKVEKLLKLIDLLEENDDVQEVFGNYTFQNHKTT
jgi:YebC/PmpR family DNA-binding regulatory protein